MKLHNLVESITFQAAKYNPEDNSFRADEEETVGPCIACDGDGLDPNDMTCPYCKGEKVLKRWKAKGPSINLANSNAYILMQMIGVEKDYSGAIYTKDIPLIKRKLISLKNRDTSAYEREDTVSRGKFVDRSGDVPRISPGATMYDMGVSSEKVARLIDQLMELLDYCQKNNLDIIWS